MIQSVKTTFIKITSSSYMNQHQLITTDNMAYTIELISDDYTEIGEGPHWDAETQSLFYVDILGYSINKYKPSTHEFVKAKTDNTPSFIIPIEGNNNKFLVSMTHDLSVITWNTESNTISTTQKIIELDPTVGNNRINDGKTDSRGILWAGTLDNSMTLCDDYPKAGNLYSYNGKARKLKHHLDGIQISNGLAFNTSLNKFYYIDSMKKTIDQFDYDAENESISNQESIFSLKRHNINGLADGHAIDTDGNLWIAIFNGGKIIKINPRVPETLLQTIDMPVKKVTSVAFGGKDLDELYVTSARFLLSNDPPPTTADGALFKITGLGVKGFGGVRMKF